MPYRIERPCKAYMCPNTTSNKSGYCDEHQGLARERRGSAYSRGYNGRWDRFRTRYLREHPLCADCLEDPLPGLPPQPATEIHLDDLDFRKWLTERGITKEEFEEKSEEEQKGIEKQYKLEHRGKSIQSFGEGMQGCGCAIMGVIILAVIIYFIYLVVAS